MAPRLDGIRFNLMRAIEEFQDLNHEDMDVMAPPSGPDFHKEREVARLFDDFLGQMIENGIFDDCDLKEAQYDDESSDIDYGYMDSAGSSNTPESTGFDSRATSSGTKGSKESLTDRFKRYIRRILPGGKSKKVQEKQSTTSSSSCGSPPQPHRHHHHHHHSQYSDIGENAPKSVSREKTSSEPFDTHASYSEAYKKKYLRSDDQASGYAASGRYSEDEEASNDYVEDDDENEDGEFYDNDSHDSHGLSNAFKQDTDAEYSDGRQSMRTRSRSSSRSRSRRGSRTRSRGGSRSRLRGRSRSRSRSSGRIR